MRPANGAVGGLIPAYLLAGASSDGVSWFVLEPKSPSARAFVRTGKRVSLSSEANHGLCQLINYIDRSAPSQDRESTRLNLVTNAHLVCRLSLAQQKTTKDQT